MVDNSNYFIDVSKKGYLTGNNNIKTASLKADLDSPFLKSFKIKYSENFTEYSKELQAKFDQLTKVVQGAIKMAFGRNFQVTAQDLRGKLMEAQILLEYFTKETEGHGNSGIDLSGTGEINAFDSLDKIVQAYNRVSIYRVPARTSMPNISIGDSNTKFSFKFAFGKCNLFNAKQEVYEPMQLLYKQLIDMKLEFAGDIEGSYTVGTLKNGIPYRAYAYVDTIEAISTLNKGISENNPFNINATVKNLMDAKSTLDSKNGDSAVLSAYIDEQINRVNAYHNGERDKKPDSGANIKTYFKGLTDSNVFDKKGVLWGSKEWYERENTAQSGIAALAEYKKSVDEGEVEVSLKKDKTGEDITDFKITETSKEASQKNLNNITSVLQNVATFDVKTVHQGLANVFDRIVNKGNVFYLHTGFLPKFVHSFTELTEHFNDLTKPDPFKNELICYGPFVPKEVEMEFDLKNLDEQGYPMSGSITITPWNLYAGGWGINLKNPGN